MSVRNGMLALLAEQPMHGYQLRQEFERRTGSTWPMFSGQVYTTLHRLVRDGLAEPVPAQGAGTGSARPSRTSLCSVVYTWPLNIGQVLPVRRSNSCRSW